MPDRNQIEIVSHTTMQHLEVFLVQMTERSPHGHDDLEIGLLLEGTLTLFLDQTQHTLQTGDIYLINRYQVHSFGHSESRNLILAFQIHTDLYRGISYPMTFLRFDQVVLREGALHAQLRDLLLSCARTYFGSSRFRELECTSLLLHTLFLLTESVPCTVSSEREYRMKQDNTWRINRITEYIAEHYRERISLEDIAEREHITACHASHFIRKTFGISFRAYVGTMRLEHALRLLLQTDLSLLDICMESGFSSTRYLNRMIEETFGCSAREFRALPRDPIAKENAIPLADIQQRYTYEQSAAYFRKQQQ